MRTSTLVVSSLFALFAISAAVPVSRHRRSFKLFGTDDTGLPPANGVITIIPAAPNAIAAAAGQAVLSGTSPGAALTAAGLLPPPTGALAGLPAVAGPDGMPSFSPMAALASLGAPPQMFLSGLSALASGSLPMIGAVQTPNVIPLPGGTGAAAAAAASADTVASSGVKAGFF